MTRRNRLPPPIPTLPIPPPGWAARGHLRLPTPAATDALAARLAALLAPGDTLLLQGRLGGGQKATSPRAAIRALIGPGGDRVDIPSPTFTLVQGLRHGTGRGPGMPTSTA